MRSSDGPFDAAGDHDAERAVAGEGGRHRRVDPRARQHPAATRSSRRGRAPARAGLRPRGGSASGRGHVRSGPKTRRPTPCSRRMSNVALSGRGELNSSWRARMPRARGPRARRPRPTRSTAAFPNAPQRHRGRVADRERHAVRDEELGAGLRRAVHRELDRGGVEDDVERQQHDRPDRRRRRRCRGAGGSGSLRSRVGAHGAVSERGLPGGELPRGQLPQLRPPRGA